MSSRPAKRQLFPSQLQLLAEEVTQHLASALALDACGRRRRGRLIAPKVNRLAFVPRAIWRAGAKAGGSACISVRPASSYSQSPLFRRCRRSLPSAKPFLVIMCFICSFIYSLAPPPSCAVYLMTSPEIGPFYLCLCSGLRELVSHSRGSDSVSRENPTDRLSLKSWAGASRG